MRLASLCEGGVRNLFGSGASGQTPGDPRAWEPGVWSPSGTCVRSQGPEPCRRQVWGRLRLGAGRFLPVDSGFSRSRKQSHAGKVDSGTRTCSLLCPDKEVQGGGGESGVGVGLNPYTGGVGRAFI